MKTSNAIDALGRDLLRKLDRERPGMFALQLGA
jgi:hypothetical protein